MSVAVMTTCWRYSQARGNDLLVLLALADIADDNGECWPSMGYIARKARVDVRSARRHVRNLEKLGEVVVVVGGGKASTPGGTRSNRYRIVVHVPAEDADPGDLTDSGNVPHPVNAPDQGSTPRGGRGEEPGVVGLYAPHNHHRYIKDPSSSAPVVEAVALIADRRMTTKGRRIRDIRAYRRSVLASVRSEHDDRAKALVAEDPTLTAEAIADLLEPADREDTSTIWAKAIQKFVVLWHDEVDEVTVLEDARYKWPDDERLQVEAVEAWRELQAGTGRYHEVV